MEQRKAKELLRKEANNFEKLDMTTNYNQRCFQVATQKFSKSENIAAAKVEKFPVNIHQKFKCKSRNPISGKFYEKKKNDI